MIRTVFGYGSLIATPEYAARVSGRTQARLRGYRREFNKRSPGRGCPRSQAYAVFEDVPDEYLTESWAFSLAVGTVESDGDSISGVVLEYPASAWPAALLAMDAREGYDAAADRAKLGYIRTVVPLESAAGVVDAVTYLSNVGGRYDLPSHVSLDVRARILINGTPRDGTPLAQETKVRGIGYLEQLRTQLHIIGWVDPLLEAQAEAVLAYDGPWTRSIAAPRAPTSPDSL